MQIDTCYLAPRGFEAELEEELQRYGAVIQFRKERLFGALNGPKTAIWADNIWLDPQFIPIASINDAAKKLKSMQRNWALYSVADHRRAALIQETLPKIAPRPYVFGTPPPVAPLGSWMLWDRDTLLASASCSSPFAHGAVPFAENKITPPNRAYLKLWEAFTLFQIFPQPGMLCLDLGSSPGGWSWVLAELGARVFSVDKALLAPHIARHPLIDFCQGSAFSLDPALIGEADWLFCDVACFPDRLLRMARTFAEANPAMSMLCTIKLSGATDFAAIEAFLDIPGSFVKHLYVNGHELTWMRPGPYYAAQTRRA